MTQYTARIEEITGASLTGSSGDANRTYTLTNSNAVAAMMKVMRGEVSLQQGVGFSFDSATNAVTFITEVWDDQDITIDYLSQDSITLSGSVYTNTLQIARVSGIGVEVFLENLGTGDASEDSFDSNNGNIVDDSYTVQYGAADSNDLSTMTETTHYTIDKDSGAVLLTSAGVTLLSTNVLYISYTYSPKHSDTLLATYLEPASREVDKITGDYWGTSKTSYEYFDGYTSGYPQTDEPFGTQIEPYPEFQLKYSNALTITSVLFLDRQGSTDTTLDSDDYRIITDDDNNDCRLLINRTIPNGKANVKVTYTHGYTSVPDLVQELTALTAGIMTLVNISGGSYKDVTGYTIGRKSFQVGEVYVNIRETITQMKKRIEQITDLLGGNYVCV